MILVSLTGAQTVSDPEFGAATVRADGVSFNLPDAFGQKLLTIAPTQWKTAHQILVGDWDEMACAPETAAILTGGAGGHVGVALNLAQG